MDSSNTIELYCEKCRKVTVWLLVRESKPTSSDFITGNALLDGSAGVFFAHYRICTECETKIRYH